MTKARLAITMGDPAGIGQRLYTCCDIDTITENITVVVDDVTNIDTHAIGDGRPILGAGFVFP